MQKYETNLIRGDCLEVMPELEEGSFDLICSDPPYGITQCEWDKVIPFNNYMEVDGKILDKADFILQMSDGKYNDILHWAKVFDKEHVIGMWENIKRILKPGGTVALFGSQPFTSKLVMSNLKWFKYELIWNKKATSTIGNAKREPLRCHENILVFCERQTKYNPQFEPEKTVVCFSKRKATQSDIVGSFGDSYNRNVGYPKSILEIMRPNNIVGDGGYHPTQKRTELLEYLIRTYTDQGDRVLDFCMGSGSTGVACQNTGRHFTGIELEEKYYKIAQQRMKENNVLLVIP